MDGTFFKPSSFESTLFIRSYKITGPWKLGCIYIDGMAIGLFTKRRKKLPVRLYSFRRGAYMTQMRKKRNERHWKRVWKRWRRCHSVLGIPFSYYCSVLGIPRYPPGMPKSLVYWSSPPKNSGFRGKIKNVLEIDSAKHRNLFQNKLVMNDEGLSFRRKSTAHFIYKPHFT